jgi:hypothetical protein
VSLESDDSIEELGFDGEHLWWWQSPEKRLAVAQRLWPPPTRWPDEGECNREINVYVGLEETVRLAVRLFDVLAGVYFARWQARCAPHEEYARWLETGRLHAAVLARLRDLWSKRTTEPIRRGGTPGKWFRESLCRFYVVRALDARSAWWRAKARRAEIAALGKAKQKRPRPKPPTNAANAGTTKPKKREPEKRFLDRAKWFAARLKERGWSVHRLETKGGPNHKTSYKILEGLPVTDNVLDAAALAFTTHKGCPPVTVRDIPET